MQAQGTCAWAFVAPRATSTPEPLRITRDAALTAGRVVACALPPAPPMPRARLAAAASHSPPRHAITAVIFAAAAFVVTRGEPVRLETFSSASSRDRDERASSRLFFAAAARELRLEHAHLALE